MSKYVVYKNENLEKEKSITRVVLFEKLRAPDFINKSGLKYWYDKNGNTIRIDNEDSTLDVRGLIGFRGSSYMDAGYIFAPFIPLETTPTISQASLIKNINGVSNLIADSSRYSKANYIICSSEVSQYLSNL